MADRVAEAIRAAADELEVRVHAWVLLYKGNQDMVHASIPKSKLCYVVEKAMEKLGEESKKVTLRPYEYDYEVWLCAEEKDEEPMPKPDRRYGR